MARNHARLLVSLWNDPDWLALTSHQHDVYAALLTTHDLSWCGVAPLLPQRLVAWAADLTLRKVQAALEVLASEVAGRFLVIDPATAEILIRSYVRHDDLLKQPNVTKAMVRSIPKVRSKIIQQAITVELGRKFQEDPDLKGWDTLRAEDPELYAKVSANPSANPFGNPSRKAG